MFGVQYDLVTGWHTQQPRYLLRPIRENSSSADTTVSTTMQVDLILDTTGSIKLRYTGVEDCNPRFSFSSIEMKWVALTLAVAPSVLGHCKFACDLMY